MLKEMVFRSGPSWDAYPSVSRIRLIGTSLLVDCARLIRTALVWCIRSRHHSLQIQCPNQFALWLMLFRRRIAFPASSLASAFLEIRKREPLVSSQLAARNAMRRIGLFGSPLCLIVTTWRSGRWMNLPVLRHCSMPHAVLCDCYCWSRAGCIDFDWNYPLHFPYS